MQEFTPNKNLRQFDQIVIVRSKKDLQTIDTTKLYYIDGQIDMNGQSIEYSENLVMKGHGSSISKLYSSQSGHTMFTNPPTGSNDLFLLDLDIEVTGENSKVFDLKDSDGTHTFNVNRVNFLNCSDLGCLENYRQGLELETSRFGGSPSLMLDGSWGGYSVTTCIVRNHIPSMKILKEREDIKEFISLYARPRNFVEIDQSWQNNIIQMIMRTIRIMSIEISKSDEEYEKLYANINNIKYKQLFLPNVLDNLYDDNPKNLLKLKKAAIDMVNEYYFK